MSNMRVRTEINCLEKALKDNIDLLKYNDKPLTREEVASTLQVMANDIIHTLNVLSIDID